MYFHHSDIRTKYVTPVKDLSRCGKKKDYNRKKKLLANTRYTYLEMARFPDDAVTEGHDDGEHDHEHHTGGVG